MAPAERRAAIYSAPRSRTPTLLLLLLLLLLRC